MQRVDAQLLPSRMQKLRAFAAFLAFFLEKEARYEEVCGGCDNEKDEECFRAHFANIECIAVEAAAIATHWLSFDDASLLDLM